MFENVNDTSFTVSGEQDRHTSNAFSNWRVGLLGVMAETEMLGIGQMTLGV
jgi:hypothetical protein